MNKRQSLGVLFVATAMLVAAQPGLTAPPPPPAPPPVSPQSYPKKDLPKPPPPPAPAPQKSN